MRSEKRPRVITTRVTDDEGAYLDELAGLDRRTVAELGYFAIQEYLARRRAGAPITPAPEWAPDREDRAAVPAAFVKAWEAMGEEDRRALLDVAEGMAELAHQERQAKASGNGEGRERSDAADRGRSPAQGRRRRS